MSNLTVGQPHLDEFFTLILNEISICQIKADLAKALFEKMLSSFTPLLFVFSPEPDCLSARVAIEEKSEMLISEEPLVLKFICFQTVAAPAFTPSFLTHIAPPSSICWTKRLFLTCK